MKYPNVTLGRVEAVWNKLGGEEGVGRFLRGELTILKFISTVKISATTTKFIARERFALNTKDKTKRLISYLGSNFKNWFLEGKGKIEDPIDEQELCSHRLQKSSTSGPILTELGGDEKSETTLTEMFSLMEKQMEKQKDGETGVLLTNGYTNIFYIEDQKATLREVGVNRYDGGWSVEALSVENWYPSDLGSRVFSRNSVFKPSEPSASAQA